MVSRRLTVQNMQIMQSYQRAYIGIPECIGV